jgi:hypothetical protein
MAAKSKKRFVVTRARLSGVMCGYLESQTADEVVLTEARQVWRFGGCETVTGLAKEGSSLKKLTRIDKPAPRVSIQREAGMVILDCSAEAEANLRQSRWL